MVNSKKNAPHSAQSSDKKISNPERGQKKEATPEQQDETAKKIEETIKKIVL